MDDRWRKTLIEGVSGIVGDILYVSESSNERWGCESPIEVALLVAWDVYWKVNPISQGGVFDGRRHFFTISHFGNRVDLQSIRGFGFSDVLKEELGKTHYEAMTSVYTQVGIGDYRVDMFAHRYVEDLGLLGPVVIECDGRDFHDSRVEDLRRDRARDRALQTSGLPVLRFTGSEIYKDPVGCIDQIEGWFKEAAHTAAEATPS